MEYVAFAVGLVLAIIGILIAEKVKLLNSTKDILGILIWGSIGFFYMMSGHINWGLLMFVGLVFMAIFDYFKNKRREQAILNTIQYMINQEHYTTISVIDINQKLNYNDVEMIEKTLNIYKSKALIPYNINIVE